jgi:hypothetical protein
LDDRLIKEGFEMSQELPFKKLKIANKNAVEVTVCGDAMMAIILQNHLWLISKIL